MLNSYYEILGPRIAAPPRPRTRPTNDEIYRVSRVGRRAARGAISRRAERPEVRAARLPGHHRHPARAAAPGAARHRDQAHPRLERPRAARALPPRRSTAAGRRPAARWVAVRRRASTSSATSRAAGAGTTRCRSTRPGSSRSRLAIRLVTNRDYLEFMEDGGYRDPLLWLSNGWATVRDQRLDGAALLGARRWRVDAVDARRQAPASIPTSRSAT